MYLKWNLNTKKNIFIEKFLQSYKHRAKANTNITANKKKLFHIETKKIMEKSLLE